MNILLMIYSLVIRTSLQATIFMPEELSTLLANVESLAPGGKTDIYAPAIKGLELMLQIKLDKYVSAIILMTERYNHRVDLCSRLMVGVDICSHFLR